MEIHEQIENLQMVCMCFLKNQEKRFLHCSAESSENLKY